MGADLPEFEARPLAGCFVVLLDGVFQPAGGAHDGQRAVFERVNLVQAARLVAGGHHEKVRSGFDPVRQFVVVADVTAHPSGVAPRQRAEVCLQPLVTGAENRKLDVHLRQDALHRLRQQVQPFLLRKAGDHPK